MMETDAEDKVRVERRGRLERRFVDGEGTFPIKIRLPGGKQGTCRFLPQENVSVLVDFIGAQEDSSQQFYMMIPGQIQVVHSIIAESVPSESLFDLGINSPVLINVQWDREEHTSPIASSSSSTGNQPEASTRRRSVTNPPASTSVVDQSVLGTNIDDDTLPEILPVTAAAMLDFDNQNNAVQRTSRRSVHRPSIRPQRAAATNARNYISAVASALGAPQVQSARNSVGIPEEETAHDVVDNIEDEDMVAALAASILLQPPKKPISAEDLIINFQIATREPTGEIKTSVLVNRADVLESTEEAVEEDENFNFYAVPEVEFAGEDATDLGGPMREYFSLLLNAIVKAIVTMVSWRSVPSH
ncbi:uncharacterized protein LOC135491122 isoform X2 [Lineus longissimus]|uniref:uncharacterized protein LOC135491122 isoform X2 n=1 Tax=Lineus longissimus TaxID=88925 RepID=UPI002B4CD1A3